MPEFHRTAMGRKFFEAQLPDLIDGVGRIAKALEKRAKRTKSKAGYLVVILDDNCDYELIGWRAKYESGKQLFLDTCSLRISNWDEYTFEDIKAILDEGYEKFGSKAVVFMDLTNVVAEGAGL